eukprot:scaffold3263_cov129-Isochrysis_galbana.AAC.3
MSTRRPYGTYGEQQYEIKAKRPRARERAHATRGRRGARRERKQNTPRATPQPRAVGPLGPCRPSRPRGSSDERGAQRAQGLGGVGVGRAEPRRVDGARRAVALIIFPQSRTERPLRAHCRPPIPG